MTTRLRGRPRKYAEYKELLSSLSSINKTKRPQYVNNIGIFLGKTGYRAFVKICLRKGGRYKGRSYCVGDSIEISLGKLSSWDWETLEGTRDKLQGKADRGEPLEGKEPVMFEVFAIKWVDRAKVRTKSKTNIFDVEKQLIPEFGNKHLADITGDDIDAWQTRRLLEVKPATVQRNKSILKAILNKAIKGGHISSNPCDSTDDIKWEQDYARYYSADETIQLCEAAKSLDRNGWFSDYILFSLYTGMRRGEILNLEWFDIKELPDHEKIIHIRTSKSDKGRTVRCNPEIIDILKRQAKRKRDFNEDLKWRHDNDNDKIFPISVSTIRRRWSDTKKIAKVKQGRMHDWRATNITYALLSGVDAKTLISITGHKDLQMIQKHYARVVDKAVKDAVIKTGSFITAQLKGAEENNKKNGAVREN